MAQLKALLDERGVTYPSNALKADLVELLEG
ncbi:HeH/LEM domain-containing protein [Enterococcus casseliflavus]